MRFLSQLCASAVVLAAARTHAEPVPTGAGKQRAAADWRVVVEIDPTNYILRGGWSATLFVRPGPLQHWRFGASVYASDLPSFAVEDRWKARIEPGFAVHAHYFPSPEAKGFFFGGLVSLNRWDYTFDAMDSVRVDELSIMPAIGYQWFPFASGLVVKPWLGVGIPLYANREPTIGTETHDRAIPVAPFVTIHLGYQF